MAVRLGGSRKAIELEGDYELARLFKELNMKPAEIRQGARFAAGIIRSKARQKAPKGTNSKNPGALKRGIVIKNSKNRKYASVWVGPNYGRHGNNRAPHAHLVAFKFTRSRGKFGFGNKTNRDYEIKSPGAVSTRKPIGQFIKQAAAENEEMVARRAMDKYVKVLDKKIAKLLR